MSQSYGSRPYQHPPYQTCHPSPAQTMQPAAFATYPHSSYGHTNALTLAQPPQYRPQFSYLTTHVGHPAGPIYDSSSGATDQRPPPQVEYAPFSAASQSFNPGQASQQASFQTYASNALVFSTPPHHQLIRPNYHQLIQPSQQQFMQSSQPQPVGCPHLQQIQPPQHTVVRPSQNQEVHLAQDSLTRFSQQQHQKQLQYQLTQPSRQTRKASGAARKRKKKNKIPWQTKLTLSAIECNVEGVQFKEPPFPFYQGWDKDAEQASGRGKKRKRDDDENHHDDYHDYDYDYGPGRGSC